MRLYTLSFLALASFFQTAAFAHKNVVLQYSLKNVSQDLAVVEVPTKKAPGDVLDGEILNAIIRSRTAGYLVQSANDRKGKIESGKLILDEMTPAPIEEESDIARATEMLNRHSDALNRAKGRLQLAEKTLAEELKKSNPDTRDFTLLKNNLVELKKVLLEIEP